MTLSIREEFDKVQEGFDRISIPTTHRSTSMTPEHIHAIARIAAESAQAMNGMFRYDEPGPLPSPAEAAANVVDAYLAAVAKLSASSGTASPESAA